MRTCHGTKDTGFKCGRPAHNDYCVVCAMTMLANEAVADGHGIFRWKSNDHVVPQFILEDAEAVPEVLKANKAAEQKDLDRFMAELRARPVVPPSDEELFEMRAAFGPGATVVNVLTGRVTKL